MLLAVQWTWQIDGWIILTGAICAAASALLGNFLVLRRMSLMGDAISHAVLPGLAAAFLFTGQRQGTAMFLGAAAVGVLTVLLTELARKYGKVEESAAIGVVFTSLFALGLLMIVRAADRVDLDPDCVLYGALETAVIDQRPFLGWMVPRVAIQLLGVLLLNLVFVFCFFRHLKVSTFDPQLAKSQGVAVSALHYALAACVAVTAVASFESVGNILVVAMFVVPPVTAWLLTDRLWLMVTLSVVVGMSASLLGHWAAKEIPTWFGYGSSNTAGMMAVASGGLLLVALLFAPRKGVLSRAWRSLQVGVQVLSEDVLAMLYRAESGGEESLPINEIRRRLSVSSLRAKLLFWWLKNRSWIADRNSHLALADAGRVKAQNLVRSHRLWEQYLASEAGFAPESLHDDAERLEHFTNRNLRTKLQEETNAPDVDPHGSPIPPEANSQDS